MERRLQLPGVVGTRKEEVFRRKYMGGSRGSSVGGDTGSVKDV